MRFESESESATWRDDRLTFQANSVSTPLIPALLFRSANTSSCRCRSSILKLFISRAICCVGSYVASFRYESVLCLWR